MNKSRFLTFFLVLTIWLSTAGFTPLPTSTIQTTANAPVPVEAMAPDPFGKISPPNGPSVTTTQVQLVWQASSGAVRYEYCIFTKANCPPGQWRSAGNSTSVTTNLKPTSSYTWQVRAVAADGSVTYADGGTAWTFTTGSAGPGTFTKIAPITITPTQPINTTLSWTATTGLNVNYQVCYDTSNNNACDGTWQFAGSGTSYTLIGLNYNQTYYWQVRAYNSRGISYANGALANFAAFKTRIAPPTPFVKLTPASGSLNMPVNMALAWSPSTGTNLSYEYCLIPTITDPGTNTCAQAGGTWQQTGTDTFVALAGLTHAQTYYWQVRALNNNDPADSVLANGGAWWWFKTLTVDYQGFVKILPVDQATDVSTTPYLYWSAAQGANITYQYCIKAGATSVCDPASVTDWTQVAGTNMYVQVNLPLRDTTYVWQIRALAQGATEYAYADNGVLRQFKTIPDAPVANPLAQSFSTQEDTQKIGQLTSTNPSNRTLTFTLSGREPASQNFLLSSTGQFTFMPQQDFNGTVTFDYTIWDGVNLPSGPYTATINVTAVNDRPVIDPVADVTVFTGGDIFFTIQTSDADLQYNDTITITLAGTLPSGATFIPAYDTITHAASADFEWLGATWVPTHSGPYIFTVRATDTSGAFAEDTFTIYVTTYTMSLPLIRK